jgi:hypothetical protein
VSPTCNPSCSADHTFPVPALHQVQTMTSSLAFVNFTAGIPNFGEFLVLQRSKERSKHGNCACLVAYCSCLSYGARTHTHRHTHTHTHTHPIISISGRGDVTVWSHVTATAAYSSSSVATQDNNSDRLLNERHRPLSTGSGFVHRKNSWMLQTECRFTKQTHCRRICDRAEGSGSSATCVSTERCSSDICRFSVTPAYLHNITRITMNTVSDHLYSRRP